MSTSVREASSRTFNCTQSRFPQLLFLATALLEPLRLGRRLKSGTHQGALSIRRSINRYRFTLRSYFSADKQFLAIGSGKTVQIAEVKSGKVVANLSGPDSEVRSVVFSPDTTKVFAGLNNGAVRAWSRKSGGELATMWASAKGDWLTVTPSGFFDRGGNANSLLHLLRGLDTLSVGQIHQSLLNPDLVRESLADDPKGDVQNAARVTNLEMVLDSGPAPFVAITSPRPGASASTDLVRVSTRIEDRGKGVGRIEWRVNGVTIGVMNTPGGNGPTYNLERELALDPGLNTVEVVAYNARNLLASLPAQTTIAYKGPAGRTKPKLHVLAIGINAYAGGAPNLNLAVPDAKALAEEMQKAGAGFYGEVRVRKVLDQDATLEGLGRAVQELADGISARDTFVLFAAAHGYSHNGRFYLIPHDYPGGTDEETLLNYAVGQEKLQDWIGNRIKAKKAVILLDTCELGALTSGYTRSRLESSASEAAIGRLHEATGRPVLTAAAEGQAALEITKLGHGVFTSAVIDALRHGDANRNGLIEISELAAHVEDLVPKLAAGAEGRSILAARGPVAAEMQSAHFGTTGGDFSLVKQLDMNKPAVTPPSWMPQVSSATPETGRSPKPLQVGEGSPERVSSSDQPKALKPLAVATPRKQSPSTTSEFTGRTNRIEDSSTLIVEGKTVRLFGVQGRIGPEIEMLRDYVARHDNTVTCKPVKAKFTCRIGPKAKDVGEAAIFFGSALAAPKSPQSYRDAQLHAQQDRLGLWKEISPPR